MKLQTGKKTGGRMMQNLEQFLRLLTGHFDNREQFNQMQKAEKVYPLAEHVNTVCNDKIRDLPADFRGKFLVEESYYETNGKKHCLSPICFCLQRSRTAFCLHPMRYRRERIKTALPMLP